MYHSITLDPNFFNHLLATDKQIARQVQAQNCSVCSGKLYQAHYERKPRGIPDGVDPDYVIRFSFCCATQGCRKRTTAPSLRFLSRKVYTSVILLLVFLLREKTDEAKVGCLNQYFKREIAVETIRRWRCFWLFQLPLSMTFKRQGFSEQQKQTMPVSLVCLFKQLPAFEQLKKSLQWLLPLSSGVRLFDRPFVLMAG